MLQQNTCLKAFNAATVMVYPPSQLVEAIRGSLSDRSVVNAALTALQAQARVHDQRGELIEAGAVEAMIDAVNMHARDQLICCTFCDTVSNLAAKCSARLEAAECSARKEAIVRAGAVGLLVAIVKSSKNTVDTKEFASLALSDLGFNDEGKEVKLCDWLTGQHALFPTVAGCRRCLNHHHLRKYIKGPWTQVETRAAV